MVMKGLVTVQQGETEQPPTQQPPAQGGTESGTSSGAETEEEECWQPDVKPTKKDNKCMCEDGYTRVVVNGRYICINSNDIINVDNDIVLTDGKKAYAVISDKHVKRPTKDTADKAGLELADKKCIYNVIGQITEVASNSECKPGGGFPFPFPLPFFKQEVETRERKGVIGAYAKAFNDLREMLGL